MAGLQMRCLQHATWNAQQPKMATQPFSANLRVVNPFVLVQHKATALHSRKARGQRTQATPLILSGDLQSLQKEYGIEGSVEVVEGKGNLASVLLKHPCGSSAQVYLYGANVLSWKQPSGDEVLYVRPDAVFDKSKPISGGIPHCFPQFGPGPAMQQHGFARNLEWQIASTAADIQADQKDPEVELVLTENEYTKKMWPFPFKAVYTVRLHGENLQTDLRVINTGDKAFDFTAALHSYIEVLDIEKATVKGLQGLTYLSKVKDPNQPEELKEERDLVTFDGPVDSVYLKAGEYVELDVGTGAAVAISSSGWEDVVVWTPWTAMESCYKHFVCVENAQFSSPAKVEPGESWRATMEMAVVDL